jgi:polyphosphate kinase 2 (PPK2 family)
MSIPQKGQIAIFNRSHYELVIEVFVHNLVQNNEILTRYRQINDFERYLSENHVTILNPLFFRKTISSNSSFIHLESY